MRVRTTGEEPVRIRHGTWYLFGKTYEAVHMVIMAATGAGKDQAGILPLLKAQLEYGDEHLVVVDPKRELRESLFAYLRPDDRVFVCSFSPATDLSSALSAADDAEQAANAAAHLMPAGKGEGKHFDESSQRLFAELDAALEEELGRRPTLVEVYDALEDPARFGDLCERHSVAARVTANEDEWGSTVSTARTHLKELRWPRVRRVFDAPAGTERPFAWGAGEGRTVVFVEPDEDAGARLEKFVALLLDRLYQLAARDGDPRGKGSKRGSKFVVDEAASYMKLEKIPQYLDIGRGRKVQLCYVLQNWPQLKDVLNPEKAERAWESTELRVVGAGASRATAEQVSKLTAERRVTFLGPRQRNWDRKREQIVRPVIKPSHVTGLRKDAEVSEWALTHGPRAELIRVNKERQYFHVRAKPVDPAWEYLVPLGLPRDRPDGEEGPPSAPPDEPDAPELLPPGPPAGSPPPPAAVTNLRRYRKPPRKRPRVPSPSGSADALEGPPTEDGGAPAECPVCGRKNPPGRSSCRGCGAGLGGPAAAEDGTA